MKKEREEEEKETILSVGNGAKGPKHQMRVFITPGWNFDGK